MTEMQDSCQVLDFYYFQWFSVNLNRAIQGKCQEFRQLSNASGETEDI